MKLGLFGGGFDPIHCGHVETVKEARRLLGLDRVVYLPTAQPPHKQDRGFAPAQARYVMVELATLDEEGLFVAPDELTEGRPAYTVETVERYRKRFSEADLHLLVGADAFRELPTWRRWRDLVAQVRLVVLRRPPGEGAGEDRLAAGLAAQVEEGRVDFVDNRHWRISSTEIREALARGERPAAGVVPPAVLRYIDKYSLYR